MLENFIYARKKELFTAELDAGNILDEAIVFIEDTKEIWNHGTYFDGSTFDPSNIEEIVSKIKTDGEGNKYLNDKGEYKELNIPTKLSELTDDVVSGSYLSINGGTLNGDLYADNIYSNAYKDYDGVNTLTFTSDQITVSNQTTETFVITKEFIDFYEGSNTATSVASLPIDRRLVIATISASESLTLSNTPDAGREIHIIVNNSSTSAISIALPNTGNYVCLTDTALSLDAGAYAEINIISDGSKMYIRSI